MSRRNRRPVAAQRDALDVTSGPLLGLSDQRLWSPAPTALDRLQSPLRRFGPAPVLVGPSRSMVRPSGRFTWNISPTIAFHAPKRVVLCVRRKQRKEVLFAKRKTGKGSRASNRRRNAYSSIGC